MESKFVNNGNEENDCNADVVDGFDFWTCFAQVHTEAGKVDENFHIYLCLGQSNMEGNAKIEACDTVDVNPRFKVLQAVDCPDLGRKKGGVVHGSSPFGKMWHRIDSCRLFRSHNGR